MTAYLAIFVLMATIMGSPLLQTAGAGTFTCEMQPSTIAVSFNDQFTVDCTYPCDYFETLYWWDQDSNSILDTVIYNRSVVQACAGPGTNGTNRLSILADDAVRDLELIKCVVVFNHAMHTHCEDSTVPLVCEEQITNVVFGEWISLNCTITCDVHETVSWLTQSMNDVSRGSVNFIHPVQDCNDSNASNVTYTLEVLAMDKSMESILCVAPVKDENRNDCILSTSFNVIEPSTMATVTTTDQGSSSTHTIPSTTTEKLNTEPPPSSPPDDTVPSQNGISGSSYQLLSDVRVLVLFMAFTLACIKMNTLSHFSEL